jgi:hypothetical protein
MRLADLCGTMALKRSRFVFRKSFVAEDPEQLAKALEEFGAKGEASCFERFRTCFEPLFLKTHINLSFGFKLIKFETRFKMFCLTKLFCSCPI